MRNDPSLSVITVPDATFSGQDRAVDGSGSPLVLEGIDQQQEMATKAGDLGGQSLGNGPKAPLEGAPVG